jgi:hypothetical protein
VGVRTSCVAIGRFVPDYVYSGFIERRIGSRWRVQLAEYGASPFGGVSCSEPRVCTAVGSQNGDPEESLATSLAVGWRGRGWHAEPTPNLSVPAGGTLTSVSCYSPTACVAVGQTPGPGVPNLFAEFSGGPGVAWKLGTVPPERSAPGSDSLLEISCAGPAFCVVVTGGPGITTWNGSKWTTTYPALPPSSELTDVSCTSPKFCLVVGSEPDLTRADTAVPLAELWNGETWSLHLATLSPTAANGALLGSDSCAPDATCMAVGSAIGGGGIS